MDEQSTSAPSDSGIDSGSLSYLPETDLMSSFIYGQELNSNSMEDPTAQSPYNLKLLSEQFIQRSLINSPPPLPGPSKTGVMALKVQNAIKSAVADVESSNSGGESGATSTVSPSLNGGLTDRAPTTGTVVSSPEAVPQSGTLSKGDSTVASNAETSTPLPASSVDDESVGPKLPISKYFTAAYSAETSATGCVDRDSIASSSPCLAMILSEKTSVKNDSNDNESEDSGCDTGLTGVDLRFNITWESVEIARLCGTNIKFVLKDGKMELLTPINIPRLRKKREPTSSSDDECEVCECTNPTMDDFYRWRFRNACSDECLVWTNPYNHGENATCHVVQLRQSRKKKERKKLAKSGEATKPAKKSFEWETYRGTPPGSLASVRAFQNPEPQQYGPNPFSEGMWMEVVDPSHPHLYCLAEVSEVKGFRMRLHFTGYPDMYDFWVNQDSHFIFPPGWCGSNGKTLNPPKNHDGTDISEKDWQGMKDELAQLYIASKQPFKNSVDLKQDQGVFTAGHGFRIGQKLEAVDKSHPGMICVATVRDILFNRILVHFDGWANEYDYWTEPWSSLIFEMGYCEKNGISISVPKGCNPAKFTWARYLEQTKAEPVAGSCFVKRIPPRDPFRVGDRLEVVDPYYPRLVRVASVIAIQDHRLHMRFDGWPADVSDILEDMDSSNIFPPRYCEQSRHPLTLPSDYCIYGAGMELREPTRSTSCSVKYCQGFGHVDPTGSCHSRSADCPYRKLPLLQRIPDRITGSVPVAATVEEKIKTGCTTPNCNGRGHISGKFASHLSTAGCPNAVHVKVKKRKHDLLDSDENALNPSSGSSNGRSSPNRVGGESGRSTLQSSNGPRRLGSRTEWLAERSKREKDRLVSAKVHAKLTDKRYGLSTSYPNENVFLPDLPKPLPQRPSSFDFTNELFQSRELRSQISSLAKSIHSAVCRNHPLGVGGNDSTGLTRESCLQDFRKPQLSKTTAAGIDSVTDVAAAFGIDLAKVPEMTCDQTMALAVKLFGEDSEVVSRFREEDIDGAGLVLLNLDNLLKHLKISLGSAVTLDGIIRRVREVTNFSLY